LASIKINISRVAESRPSRIKSQLSKMISPIRSRIEGEAGEVWLMPDRGRGVPFM
jgi:hypothetical protein